MVKKNVLNGTWSQRFVLSKDQSTYRSALYNYFRLIYDGNENVVQKFFVCSGCGYVFNLDLNKNGNAQLRRHECYVNFMEQQQQEEDVEEEEEVEYLPINIAESDEENIEPPVKRTKIEKKSSVKLTARPSDRPSASSHVCSPVKLVDRLLAKPSAQSNARLSVSTPKNSGTTLRSLLDTM